MIFKISHRTTFSYTQPVSISRHALHITPRRHRRQACRRSVLTVDPQPAVNTGDVDYFGNPVTFLTIQEPHERLVIHAMSVVEVDTPPALDPLATEPWERVKDGLSADLSSEGLDAFQFAFESSYTRAKPAVGDYALESFRPGRPVLEAALDLTQRIFRDFVYDGTATTISTPVDQVFRERRGVCQDFAHLQIAAIRQIGLPARYVSGYLLTYPPPGTEKLVGSDASHAWLSVWCGRAGWVDFDPTNNKIPTTEHITLAWGRDYGDVSPIRGVMIGGADHTIDVAVDVTPMEGAAEPVTPLS